MSRIERTNDKHKRAGVRKPNFLECVMCFGLGDCPACNGTGLDGGKIGAGHCDVCAASAVCIECNGSGVEADDAD